MLKHKILIATITCLLPVTASASIQDRLSSSISKAQNDIATAHELQSYSIIAANSNDRRKMRKARGYRPPITATKSYQGGGDRFHEEFERVNKNQKPNRVEPLD